MSSKCNFYINITTVLRLLVLQQHTTGLQFLYYEDFNKSVKWRNKENTFHFIFSWNKNPTLGVKLSNVTLSDLQDIHRETTIIMISEVSILRPKPLSTNMGCIMWAIFNLWLTYFFYVLYRLWCFVENLKTKDMPYVLSL